MKLAERKFVRVDYSRSWCLESKKQAHPAETSGEFCSDSLTSRFDIPDSVEIIWIALHDCAGADRWPAKIAGARNNGKCYGYLKVFTAECVLGEVLDHDVYDEIFNPLIGKEVWIEVQYYEGSKP